MSKKIVKWFDGADPTKLSGAETKMFISFSAMRPVMAESLYLKPNKEVIACMEIDERGITVTIRPKEDVT